MNNILRFLFFLIFLLGFVLHAQNFNYYYYNDNNGIINNSVKTIAQDSSGFIWIGTDGGLVLFDGHTFSTNNSALPSTYIKNISIFDSNRIVVLSDLGVGYVHRTTTSFTYKPILIGTTNLSDSQLAYPKNCFKDSKGNFWISDQAGIVRLKDNSPKKYLFPERFRSDSYFRSFQFAETTTGKLLVSSWKCGLFYFDYTKDKFQEIKFSLGNNGNVTIDEIHLINDRRLLIASSIGIYEVLLNNELAVVSQKRIVNTPEISSFVQIGTEKLIVGTWNNGVYLADIQQNTIEKLNQITVRNISKIFKDRDGGIWVCSNEGLILLKESPFIPALINSKIRLSSNYIRNLVSDEKGTVYFSDQEYIFKVTEAGPQAFDYTRIHSSGGKRVYSFVMRNNEMWVSYRDGDFTYQGKGKRNFLTSHQIGGRLSSMKSSKDGSLCCGVIERLNKIVVMDKDLHCSYVEVPPASHQSQKIVQSPDGTIYYIYADSVFHVYEFDIHEKKLLPKILKKNLTYSSSIILNDIFIQNENNFFIATNLGLLEAKNGVLTEYLSHSGTDSKNFYAVVIDKGSGLWIGTGNQLLRSRENTLMRFTQQDGLPNSTISPAGLVVDAKGRLWCATAGGLAYIATTNLKINKSLPPVVLYVTVNNSYRMVTPVIDEIYGNQDVKIAFSSLVYPARVDYQYRIIGFRDEWVDLHSNVLDFISLTPGNYPIEIRARQSGREWSAPTLLQIEITPYWFARWWMYPVYGFAIIVLVFLVILKYQKLKLLRMQKEKQILESLVHEKTSELLIKNSKIEALLLESNQAKDALQVSNTELIAANKLKNELLGVASHDLKNPLSTIISYSQIVEELAENNAELKRIAKIIFTAGMNMLRLITELLDSAMLENAQLQLAKVPTDLTELCNQVYHTNVPRAELKQQKITTSFQTGISFAVDARWMREAIENLISNAIKYSPLQSEIHFTLTQNESQIKIAVQDFGPGLTDTDKKRMFGKFIRLSAKPTGGESSTGLGLSIVKEIVTLHKGEIIVQSSPGKGATFTIVLDKTAQ